MLTSILWVISGGDIQSTFNKFSVTTPFNEKLLGRIIDKDRLRIRRDIFHLERFKCTEMFKDIPII